MAAAGRKTGIRVKNLDKGQKREAIRFAEKIRSKRDWHIVSKAHDLADPTAGKVPLIDYAQRIAETMPPKTPVPKSIRYLAGYAGSVTLDAINERWLEDCQHYPKSQDTIGVSTQAKYYTAIAQILNTGDKGQDDKPQPGRCCKGRKGSRNRQGGVNKP